MIKKTLIIVFIFLTRMLVIAQQMPVTDHSYVNPVLYNPAEIGQHDYPTVFMHSRQQWLGIPGAPELYMITVDGAQDNKKTGLALNLINDNSGITTNLGAGIGYRYRVDFRGTNHSLSMGMLFGINKNSIDFEKIRIENTNDKSIFANADTKTAFDANLGFLYKYKQLKTGFSINNLFGSKILYINQTDNKSLTYRFIRHFLFMTSYTKNINSKFDIEPRLLLKSAQGMPIQFEFGTYAKYSQKIWAGATYKHLYAVDLALGGNFYNRYNVGYSFGIPIGSIRKFTSGSHEIVVGVKLFVPKEIKTKYDNTDPEEDVEKLKRISQEQYEEIERLQAENLKMKKELSQTSQKVDVQEDEVAQLRSIYKKDSATVKKVIDNFSQDIDQIHNNSQRNYRVNYKAPDTSYIDTTIESSFKDISYYVVISTFVKLSDAKLFQRILIKEFNLRTSVLPQSDNVFFVYSRKYSESMGVKRKMDRHIKDLEKMGLGKYIQGSIWIFKTKD